MSKWRTIKYHSQNLFRDFFYGVGLRPRLPEPEPGTVTIVIYHGLVPNEFKKHPNSKFITQAEFGSHLSWFKSNCQLLSLNDLWEGNVDQNVPNIVITFDDGFESMHSILRPIVELFRIPIGIFITTALAANRQILWPDLIDLCGYSAPDKIELGGHVFKKSGNRFYNNTGLELKAFVKQTGAEWIPAVYDLFLPLWNKSFMQKNVPYWKLLDGKQIQDLHRNDLITIGAHGVIHANQEFLSDQDAAREMRESKRWLEHVIGDNVNDWAFPDGSYNERDLRLGETMGYKTQHLVTARGPVSKTGVYERLGMNPYISWNNQIRALGRGRYV